MGHDPMASFRDDGPLSASSNVSHVRTVMELDKVELLEGEKDFDIWHAHGTTTTKAGCRVLDTLAAATSGAPHANTNERTAQRAARASQTAPARRAAEAQRARLAALLEEVGNLLQELPTNKAKK